MIPKEAIHAIATVQHALDDLKLGLPINVAGRVCALAELQKIDALSEEQYLLISPNKAKTWGMDERVMRLTTPSTLDMPPDANDAQPGDTLDTHIIALAKLTGFLPYVLVGSAADRVLTTIDTIDDIQTYIRYAHTAFEKVEETAITLNRIRDAKLMLFRSPAGREHLVIQAGELSDTPIVRVHSACITGDLFESLRCDCGQQLHRAMEVIQEEGGLILYLHQEGRDIGIFNKLRAYNLQHEGMDTVQANEMLGFAPDERRFSVASDILKQMGITRIRLLTNNPKKRGELEAEGIEVVERLPIAMEPQCVNARYLQTKKDKLGHWM